MVMVVSDSFGLGKMVSGLSAPTIVPLRFKGNSIEDHKSKFEIDTTTAVELKCPSSKADIFYTTNGSTPDIAKRGVFAKFTYKYDNPFYLPAGKYLIKAVAVDRNGLESSVNAKLFRVSQNLKVRKDVAVDDDVSFMKSYHRDNFMSLEDDVSRSAFLRKSLHITEQDFVPPLVSSRQNYLAKSQQAFEDSRGSFCTHCGFNEFRGSQFCSNCGAKLVSYILPQTGRDLRRNVTDFDMLNSMSNCPMNVSHQNLSTFQPRGGNVLKFCTTCGKDNGESDLYCSKCGLDLDNANRVGSIPTTTCVKCSCLTPKSSRFCLSCGCLMLSDQFYDGNNSNTAKSIFPGKTFQNWENVSIPIAKLTLKNSVATQTTGLFYPTGQEKYNERRYSGKKITEPVMPYKERKSVKNEESPGKGFWVGGVEFIQAAIAEYVERHAESRVLLSQMKLRNLEKFEMERDEKLATMTLSFKVSNAVKRDKSSKTNKEEKDKSATGKESRKSRLFEQGGKVSGKRDGSSSSRSSSKRSQSPGSQTSGSWSSSAGKSGSTRKVKQKRVTSSDVRKYEQSLAPLDALLLKAVASNEPLDTIEGYLEEGADVNVFNAKGLSVLAVAVKEENLEAIPFLVKHGADIDRFSNGDTPLHLSVSVKSPKPEVVRTLLENRANVNKRNSRGKTVLDVATEKDVDKQVMSLLKAATERPGSANVASSQRRRSSIMTSNLPGSSDVF